MMVACKYCTLPKMSLQLSAWKEQLAMNKLCLTTWKTLHTSQPLSELISHYLPPRSLRSSNTNLLTRPAGITNNFPLGLFVFCTLLVYPIHL